MAWFLVFWRNQSTATLVPAASASQARSRAQRRHKKGYGAIVTARRANPEDARLVPRSGRGGSGAVIAGGCALLCKANRLTFDPWPP